jgi:hypothetical protein
MIVVCTDNRIFFPLRSNIGWFQSPNLKTDITNRVKEAILIYDEILIEDGTFEAKIFDPHVAPSALHMYIPPGFIPSDEREIEHQRDIEPTIATIGMTLAGGSPVTLFHGECNRFKIDYYELFKDMEISDIEFIKLLVLQNDYDLPSDAKDLIERQSKIDKDLFENINPDKALRNLLIDNLNHDIVASIWLTSAVALDPSHNEILEKKCNEIQPRFKKSSNQTTSAIKQLLDIPAPDFSKITMNEIFEMRNDRKWENFRSYVTRTLSAIKDDPEIYIDSDALEKMLHYEFERELLKECEKTMPSKHDLVIDIALGLIGAIPGLSAVTTASGISKSAKNYCDARCMGLAFLMDLKKYK